MSQPAYRYRATISRVVDGDTYEFEIDLGFKVSVRHMIRLFGLDTPEMNTEAGVQARLVAFTLLINAKEIVIETSKLRSGADAMSFNRYIANVWVDGVMLQELMS